MDASSNVVSSPSPDLPLDRRTLFQQMWEGPAALEWPERVAVVSQKNPTLQATAQLQAATAAGTILFELLQ